MTKLSAALAILLAVPSISTFAATPTQEAILSVDKVCASQPAPERTYRECNLGVAYFPFDVDPNLQSRFKTLSREAGYKVVGNPLAKRRKLSPQIEGFFIG